MSPYANLLARVRTVRFRLRVQAMVKGAALFLGCYVLLHLLGIWGAELFGFKSGAVWTLRILIGALTLFVLWRFVYSPWRRRISDVQVAQYIEERYPELQDRLVTAVECGEGSRVSPGLLELLLRDAFQKVRSLDFSVFLDRRRLVAYGAAGLGALTFLLVLLSWGPSYFSYGFDRLYFPWTQDGRHSPLMIEVRPGDVEITQGSDLQVEARMIGLDTPDARLLIQPEGSAAWNPLPMERSLQGGEFAYLLVDVQSSLSYYVEAGGIRSPSYNIRCLPLARVERIDLSYHFPGYTGMQSQSVEGEGDISALKGTRVELKIHLSKPAASGRLLFDDQSEIELKPVGEQLLEGSLVLRRSGTYLVQLADDDGKPYPGSREYDMEAIDDQPPKVTITRPMRDVRATSVEEVFTEVSAEDDIGVASLQLMYSVNGSEEKAVPLFQDAPAQRSLTSAHTFFLEEFELQPGDLISYYAKASDGNSATGPGAASSDIYFIQVRPFENKLTQSQQGAMPGGGGGGEGTESLSRQQKEIIAATFKLIRDKELMDSKEYSDGLNALALVQSRLQTQAQGVVDRMVRRGAAQAGEEFVQLGEYLKAAIAQMQKAAVDLGAQDPEKALPSEQKALQQLLRAESLFLEIQISFGSQGSGGQGGGQADAEDLADLFELELNKLKNQYETVQRGERQQRDQELDEASERLKELAQRQKQLNEGFRNMMRRGSSSGSSSGAGDPGQQQLMSEAEELARQLQRLSRERSSPELNRVGNQLQQAIQEMRKSLQSQRSGRDSTPQGVRALEQLDQARRALDRERSTGLAQGLENALEESRQIQKEQERIQADVDRMIAGREQAGDAAGRELREELTSRKTMLADKLRNLEGSIQDLSRQARKDQPETSTKLNEAAGSIRERRLPERILSGNRMLEGGYLDSLKGREDYIRAALDEVHSRLEDAKDSIGQTREGRLEDALTRTRRLAEGLEGMQRRLQGMDRGNAAERPGDQSARTGNPQDPARRQPQPGNPAEGGARGGQQRGSERAGAPGREASRGQSYNSFGLPLGVGPYTGEDVRQLSREAQQRILDAQELRRLLDRNSTQMQNLEEVIAQLIALDNQRRYNDPEEAARLREAIDLLRQLELDLSRDLARLTQRDKLLYADDNEAPDQYRRLVEEYYRALAAGRPR